jgi:hypothetical protein
MSCVRQPKFSEDMANTLKLIEATSTDGAVIEKTSEAGASGAARAPETDAKNVCSPSDSGI